MASCANCSNAPPPDSAANCSATDYSKETSIALLVNDDCTACDACIESCPNKAITAGSPYVIDPLLCTECVGAEDEPQCMIVCPADCIVPHPDFRESKEQLLEKYKSLHG